MTSNGIMRVLGPSLFTYLVLGIASPLPLVLGQTNGEETITSHPASGRPISIEGITPSDVLARSELVRQELTAIQEEMGKTVIPASGVIIHDASPFEVYFQARALFEKTNRLALEQMGALEILEPPLTQNIRPYHVWLMVDQSYQRLRLVKNKLGITTQFSEVAQDDTKTPTDVFRSILHVNRQFDALLDRKYSPRDVFRQVTWGIHHMARLLSEFPKATRLPNPPVFERKKRPFEVYLRLADCHTIIATVAKRSGIQTLTIDTTQTSATTIFPSDVYSLASLIVADLDNILKKIPRSKTPQAAYDPGRKLPSQVFQRAGILLAQTQELDALTKRTPQWTTSIKHHDVSEPHGPPR